MQEQSNIIRIKRKTILYIAVLVILLVGVTPALADYLGPKRMVTEDVTVCKVHLYECNYVAAKDTWKYTTSATWPCSSESKPWQNYPSNSHTCNDTNHDAGYEYWDKVDSTQTVTTTYPEATISSSLQNCTLQNGWCVTVPQLSLSAIEPVAGYSITAIEGSLNGQTFACTNPSCSVPLNQGNNSFAYWALSTFGDSSTMGTLAANVDSVIPSITGSFTGIVGSNGWYLSSVSLNASANDATSGLASYTCTLDGSPLGSCNTISITNDGLHPLVLTARDNAGLVRTAAPNILIDTKNPTLNASISGTLGSNNWYTAATLNGSASDPTPGSGLSTFEYNLDSGNWATFPASGSLPLSDGQHTVNLRAVDKAGHTVSSSKSFSLDTVVPDLTMDSSGSKGMNDWYISHPSITASASDETSGMDTLEYSLDDGPWETYTEALTLSDGPHHVSFWAQDEAGLVTQKSGTYQVDTGAPQIAGSLSGIPGLNGWYTSEVTISASASDPLPGSGLDSFTYTTDGGEELPYTELLSFPDGQHIVQFKAQDKAGLSYSIEQTFQVDTIPPSLSIESAIPNWVKGEFGLHGSASDAGSGISTIEISIDGGQSWQTATGTDAWSYLWNTLESANGIYQVSVRSVDRAGLTTQQTFNVSVDHRAPEISLPDSWFQWDTVTLNIWDEGSGLSEARVEISDPEGRWPSRVIPLDSTQFPLSFKWDRRFGDDTVAEAGTYNVKVIAVDRLGSEANQNASIRVLLDILPPGPTATLQPTHEAETATPALLFTITPISSTPTLTTPTSSTLLASTPTSSIPGSSTPVFSTPISSPTATHKASQTAVVSVFGSMDPIASVTPTPAIVPTPRTTPTQSTTLDWLQSIFVPNATEKSITKTELAVESKDSPQPVGADNNGVLWGTAATAAISAAIAYAQEEKRKREEEKARQAALEEAEEERREKAKERHMEKMEAKRAQEEVWEEARKEQEAERDSHVQIDRKMERIEMEEQTQRLIAQMEAREARRQAEEAKKAEEKKEADKLNAQMAAYYMAPRPEAATVQEPEKEKAWWQKSLDWIDEHQTEIALGIGVMVGVGAIILSGGVAAPMVAAAWAAGAAVVAGGAVSLGTMGLNAYYGRPWNTNLARNITVAEISAAVVTGGWFLLQGAMLGAGSYCAGHTATCSHVEPILNGIDTAEEAWLSVKLHYQTWKHDPAAQDTSLELMMEHLDGGMPGNSVAKELDKELENLSGDAIRAIEQHGDDIIPLLLKYRDDAVDLINAYGDEGIALLQKYGDDAIGLVKQYGTPAVKVLASVGPEAGEKLLETLDGDVLEYAIGQGPDAVEALSLWSAKDLEEHGVELALRAEKDAKVLSDVRKLIALGPLDPKHLTQEQRALIDAIAANSTQYAEGGQTVLGKWIDISNGFVQTANDTGSIHYNPHPEMWKLLGGLGEENQAEVAWLINQQVVQTGINKGLPFEYTLNGVPTESAMTELTAVQAIFSGKPDKEIMRILKSDYLPIRMKELQELQKAGYEFVFDEINNSYIFTLP